ncbi:LemA family protein [Schwartzia succinivorans]|uniref:LemA protein n=1 Tax=Schwartzia succinivorans DSM 10502 TaxID=1123243 RepID=A0A1M4YYH2_9FIRM|nr:LemA family protein [Schwartzia succinivorans]SHF10790.1 LemA protein [Schwartzia succinivorans DSM 10502]
MRILGVILGVLLLVAGCFVGIYNSLKTARIDVDAQYGQVENQIQRRADLIPNLVNTVKGYMQYEEKTLKEVTEARTRVMGAGSPEEMAAANDQLSGALGRLIAVAENYPQLKSDAHFTELMREIAGSENRIAVARRDYNDAIKRYNVKIETFPGNMFAGMMGYTPMKQFAAEEAAHAVPQVKF